MSAIIQQPYLNIQKYSYVDILRGIAIIGVVACHSNEQKIRGVSSTVSWILNYGQLGVQLFFVASALTLCLSMSERHENSVQNFYIRRFFRIAPLYYFGIALYLLWGCFNNYLLSGNFTALPQYDFLGIFTNLTFLHGFYPPANNNIVPGGWSIATEMLFYVLFPFLYRTQLKWTNQQYIYYSIIISFVCALITLTIHFFWHNSPSYVPGFIYFSIFNQLNVFLIGIYTYRILKTKSVGKKEIFIGVLFTLISCFLLNSEFDFKLNRFIFPILSALSFMILALRLSSQESNLNNWFWATLKRIGQLSFSIYIVHWLFLDSISSLFNNTAFGYVTNPEVRVFLLFFSVLVASYLFSTITNKYIEIVGINIGKKFIKRTNEMVTLEAKAA